MKELSAELETVVNGLVELCCESMRGGEVLDHDRVDELVALLQRHGWGRYASEGPPLSVRLQNRVMERCSTDAKYHAEQVAAVTDQVEKRYHAVARQSDMPQPELD